MKILPTAKYICQPEFVERLLCAEQVSCFRVKLLVESREDTEEIAIWNQYLDSIFRRNTSMLRYTAFLLTRQSQFRFLKLIHNYSNRL